jgi:ribosomal-protein-serine acetyltransferase
LLRNGPVPPLSTTPDTAGYFFILYFEIILAQSFCSRKTLSPEELALHNNKYSARGILAHARDVKVRKNDVREADMNLIDRNIRLSDGFVLLRPYRIEDADQFYHAAIESKAELMPWVTWIRENYSLSDAREWVQVLVNRWGKEAYDFAVFAASGGQFLGSGNLSDLNSECKSATLGYWVRTSRARGGVATATAHLLIHFGFEELGLNRIAFMFAVSNAASQRVAEKVGATREGILRNGICVRETIFDATLFSIIPSDIRVGV